MEAMISEAEILEAMISEAEISEAMISEAKILEAVILDAEISEAVESEGTEGCGIGGICMYREIVRSGEYKIPSNCINCV